MYNESDGIVSNETGDYYESTIKVSNYGSGDAYGIYSNGGTVINSGDIIVENHTDNTNSYGIYGEDGTTITNSGTITVSNKLENTSAYGFGIFTGKNSTVTNTGTIILDGYSEDHGYGIKAGSGSTIANSGTIKLDEGEEGYKAQTPVPEYIEIDGVNPTQCYANEYGVYPDCKPCPKGATSPAGSTTVDACQCSNPEYVIQEESWACVDPSLSCNAGQYWNGTSCSACPEHSTSPISSIGIESCTCDNDYPVKYNNACYAELDCGDHGEQVGNTCECAPAYTGEGCNSCNTGYGTHGSPDGTCYADLTCTGLHQEQKLGSCVCQEGFPVAYEGNCYAQIQCDEGEYQQGDECVPIGSAGISANGYTFVNGQDTGVTSYTNTANITMTASDFNASYSALKALYDIYENSDDWDFAASGNYWKAIAKGTSVLSAVSNTGDSITPTITNTADITVTMHEDDDFLVARGMYAVNGNIVNSGEVKLLNVPYAYDVYDGDYPLDDTSVALRLEAFYIGVQKNVTPSETRTFSLINNGTVRIDGADATYGAWGIGIVNYMNEITEDDLDELGWNNTINLSASKVTGVNNGTIYATNAVAVHVENASFTNNNAIYVNNGENSYYLPAVDVYAGIFVNANGAQITIDNGEGIYAWDYSTVENYGTVTVLGYGTGIRGFYSTIKNYGTINVSSGYGIYAYGGTVHNAGTITINGVSHTSNTAQSPYIVLEDGATMLSSGTLSTPSVLDLNAFSPDGTGKVALLEGGKFEAPKIVGNLHIDNSNIANGFETTYTAKDAINSTDTTDLHLISDSHLFNASLSENGSDVVMTMKSFDSVVNNKSLAAFLEKNYALANNEKFFNEIKGIGNASAFESAMNSLTATDTIGKFAHEDLTVMRELNLQMNEKMFANDDKQIYQTHEVMRGFSFKNDNNSSANYALATRRLDPRWKIGYAMSNTTLNTDDDNDTTRRGSMFSVFMPIGYENSGIKLISTPQIAFQRSHYTRQGYNNTSYEGIIEKRTFALMNEARYPVDMNSFTLIPTMEFNAIAYNQKGGEQNKAYALTMPSDNNLSVEAGIGLKAAKAFGDWKFNAGIMMYKEFADPYNVKMGMRGMDGTFDLYDDTSKYRSVANFGFDYDVNEWNIYGKIQHFMESDTHTNMKAGLRYRF